METEFSNLNSEERVGRCLEHAQSALDRAHASEDLGRKEINANLAACWQSTARQFEMLSLLREDLKRRRAAYADQQALRAATEADHAELSEAVGAGLLIGSGLPVAA